MDMLKEYKAAQDEQTQAMGSKWTNAVCGQRKSP